MFESLVAADERFEVAAKRHLGMVVFRLKVNITLEEVTSLATHFPLLLREPYFTFRFVNANVI